jgi:hypothetical protein
MQRALLGLVLAAACSAPTTAPPGAGSPPVEDADPHANPTAGAAPPASPAPPPEAAPPPPPEPTRIAPAVQPTATDKLPAAPFTAWTTTAPLTLVAPGGRSVAAVASLGVRVEVLQVLDARLRVRCVGCPPETVDTEGWVQPGHLRAARRPGASHDPITGALKRRAQWAQGAGLPTGASPGAGCALVDRGFTLDGDTATWEQEGGRLALTWDGTRWLEGETTIPATPEGWPCRLIP